METNLNVCMLSTGYICVIRTRTFGFTSIELESGIQLPHLYDYYNVLRSPFM